MFLQPKPKTRLEIEIDRLVLELKDHAPGTDKYGVIVERLSKLHKVQAEKKPARVNPDTALTVAAHLAGIVLILNYEHFGPITSKALSFVPKPK